MVGMAVSLEGYSADQTVFLCTQNGTTRNIVDAVCKRHAFSLFDAAEMENSITDWLAIPFFVCVVDSGWYIAHQDEIVEYHKMGVNDSITIIQVGGGPVRKKDGSRFVPLSDSDIFKALESLIIHEKEQFDRNLVKNSQV